MKMTYNSRYKERLFVIITEFFNFYSKMSGLQGLVELWIQAYLRDGLPDPEIEAPDYSFDIEVFQNYFRHHQGANREFLATINNNVLIFSIDVWSTITSRRQKEPAMFQAALEIDGYKVTLTCDDLMAFKLMSTILTKIAFINGPAFHDNVIVDGETFKMAYYIAACFYKLGGDPVGYLSTLDEARDLS